MARRAHALPLGAAVVAAASLLLAGCGSDGGSGPSAAKPQDDAAGERALATPAAAALAFMHRLGDSQYGAACQVLTPGNHAAIARLGKDCQRWLAEKTDPDDQAEYRAVRVDESLVVIDGDVAEIPAAAFSTPGVEQDETDDDLRLQRIGVSWYVALDQR
jgi:hypothetical protein